MLIPLQYPADLFGPPQGYGTLWWVVPHWGCNSEYRSHHLAVQCCSFFDHQLEHFQGPDAPFVPGIQSHHAEVTLTCQALWSSVATTYLTTCWSLGTCNAVQCKGLPALCRTWHALGDRIVKVRKDLKDHWVQPLTSHCQVPLNHDPDYHIYISFKYFQEWWLNHFMGQPIPMSDNPFPKEIFPSIQSKPSLVQF